MKITRFEDIYASLRKTDRFGTIFDGMCKSKAYQRLSIGARQFYTLCRVQSQTEHGKACLYKHGHEYGLTYSTNDFVFPAKHLEYYGVKRSNACRYFKELMAAGFIERKEQNKHMKRVNVYSFSSKWKDSG